MNSQVLSLYQSSLGFNRYVQSALNSNNMFACLVMGTL